MSLVIQIKKLYIKEIDEVIDYEFHKGINYLKGKNGSGKTLLLDYISKLRIPSKQNGNVEISGSVIYMRQNFTFYNRLTVFEYIKFIQKLNGSTVESFYEFLKRYRSELSISAIKNKKIGLLSGGERRLLYVLSILSLKRSWYILDEPFSNLDSEKVEQLLRIIEKMNSDEANFIITAHGSLNIKPLTIIDFDELIMNDTNTVINHE